MCGLYEFHAMKLETIFLIRGFGKRLNIVVLAEVVIGNVPGVVEG